MEEEVEYDEVPDEVIPLRIPHLHRVSVESSKPSDQLSIDGRTTLDVRNCERGESTRISTPSGSACLTEGSSASWKYASRAGKRGGPVSPTQLYIDWLESERKKHEKRKRCRERLRCFCLTFFIVFCVLGIMASVLAIVYVELFASRRPNIAVNVSVNSKISNSTVNLVQEMYRENSTGTKVTSSSEMSNFPHVNDHFQEANNRAEHETHILSNIHLTGDDDSTLLNYFRELEMPSLVTYVAEHQNMTFSVVHHHPPYTLRPSSSTTKSDHESFSPSSTFSHGISPNYTESPTIDGTKSINIENVSRNPLNVTVTSIPLEDTNITIKEGDHSPLGSFSAMSTIGYNVNDKQSSTLSEIFTNSKSFEQPAVEPQKDFGGDREDIGNIPDAVDEQSPLNNPSGSFVDGLLNFFRDSVAQMTLEDNHGIDLTTPFSTISVPSGSVENNRKDISNTEHNQIGGFLQEPTENSRSTNGPSIKELNTFSDLLMKDPKDLVMESTTVGITPIGVFIRNSKEDPITSTPMGNISPRMNLAKLLQSSFRPYLDSMLVKRFARSKDDWSSLGELEAKSLSEDTSTVSDDKPRPSKASLTEEKRTYLDKLRTIFFENE